MDIFDTNRTGGIDFNEFTGLWRYIEEWQGVFQHFDKDRSGTIDRSELQKALDQFGMKLPQHLLSLLVAKFGTYTIPTRLKCPPLFQLCLTRII